MRGILTRLHWPKLTLRRPSWKLFLALLGVPFVYEAGRILIGDNFHVVIPGYVYRCNQPTANSLPRLLNAHGIRTVINLRGFCPGPDAKWYHEEIRVTNAAGVCQEDITFSANRLPPPAELRRLIDVLDHADPPVLMHCKQGADRTGLASVVALLLFSDAELSQARHQLLPRYGHFRFGRTAAMDEFFDLYADWLAQQGQKHSPAVFREWATRHYTPGPAAGELQLISHNPHQPIPAKRNEWLTLKVRASNRSSQPWVFKPGSYAGIHLQFTLHGPDGQGRGYWQAGLFDRVVAPGDVIDLTLAVPPMAEPGRYSLRADLMDATGASVPIRQNGFYQFGADPLMLLIEIP